MEGKRAEGSLEELNISHSKKCLRADCLAHVRTTGRDEAVLKCVKTADIGFSHEHNRPLSRQCQCSTNRYDVTALQPRLLLFLPHGVSLALIILSRSSYHSSLNTPQIPPSYVLQEADGFGIHLLSNGLPLYIPEEGLSTDHIQVS